MVEVLKGGIVKITNARIMMKTRNFSGEEKLHNGRVINAKGVRTFCVIIDDATIAQQMANDGWNIHILPPREEDEASYYLSVTVGYKVAPPKIIMISGENNSVLTERTVGNLDFVDISKVDMAIRPRYWEDDRAGGAKRIKAYLKTMYVTLEQDEFQDEYGDISGTVDDDKFINESTESDENNVPW